MARQKRFPQNTNKPVQPKKRDPRKIGDVVSDLMARRGYAQVQSADDCQQAWKKVVGNLEKFTVAGQIRHGTLHVQASNSVVIQELTFRKKELIAAMARELPRQPIKEIRFRLGTI